MVPSSQVPMCGIRWYWISSGGGSLSPRSKSEPAPGPTGRRDALDLVRTHAKFRLRELDRAETTPPVSKSSAPEHAAAEDPCAETVRRVARRRFW